MQMLQICTIQFIFLMMKYAICSVPAAPVRKEASHRSEMVNQLLFGETMEVLEEKDEWLHIRSLYDNYEGWLTWHLIEPVENVPFDGAPKYVVHRLLGEVMWDGTIMHVPMGAHLTGLDPDTGQLWREGVTVSASVYKIYKETETPDFTQIARLWLHAPYLWGGKTLMGVDCSGFVQTVYKTAGIKLRRDAWQQATQGEPVTNLLQACAGDLAFFHNEQGRVIHVGMLLSPASIIHASGKVRIDTIDEEGIIHQQTGRRTHRLHSIRRVGKN
jgi:gamma-D-glutamyl-L-lysine dipeptidyl-peptidase